MLVTVFCPIEKKEVQFEVTKINTKHLIKLISTSERLGGKLLQAGQNFQLDKNNITGIMMSLISSDLITFFLEEGMDIVADIINKPLDYVQKLDPADTIELIAGIIEETDFEKLGKAVKKLMQVGARKIPTNK